MKKLILFLFLVYANADVYNSYFQSLHANKFNGALFSELGEDYTVSFSGKYNMDNFRVFVPNYTNKLDIMTSRVCSCGWFTFAVSLGKLPSIYNSSYQLINTFKGGSQLRRNNGQYYDGETDFMDGLDYGSKLISGQTLVTHKEETSYNKNILFGDGSDLNKWLYFATDTRLSEDGSQNPVAGLTFQARYFFNKAQVNDLYNTMISRMDQQQISEINSKCSSVNQKYKKICFYIKSFGDNGSNFEPDTHSKTAEAYDEIFQSLKKKEFPLSDGWNLVGPHYKAYYFSASSGISDFHSFENKDWKLSGQVSIGNGFWVKSEGNQKISFYDIPDGSNDVVVKTKMLDKAGWHLLSAPIDTSASVISQSDCVKGVYTRSNRWKKGSDESNFDIDQNYGFWVKTTSDSCTISY